MEYISGYFKLKDIFLDNGNWWKLFVKYRQFITPNIIINVLKMLVCGTRILGSSIFECLNCGHTLKVNHTCKSRFCSPCGKKATDNWIKNSYNRLPNTLWQHITFTMPDQIWDLFWKNRYLMNEAPRIAANIILKLSKDQGTLPGIFLAIHTFGRNLKRNFHIHLSTTLRGLSLSKDAWINKPTYFHHQKLKAIWRYEIISLLRKEAKKGALKMPPKLEFIKSYSSFNALLNQLYNKTWVIHLNKSSDNLKLNVEYLGKYLKRPPIGETRIKHYDGKSLTFEFLDHYTDTKQTTTLPVLDFIARLIDHIPDKNFRNIRYYGFLANRVSGKLLPLVFDFLNQAKRLLAKKVYTPWRDMIFSSLGIDPMYCLNCGTLLQFRNKEPPFKTPLIDLHKGIANGYIPLHK
jgi:hypothetical protein